MLRLVIAACALAAPAVAQQAPSRHDEARDDIVITAQRREQGAQAVPISLTALSAARLENEAILNLDRIGAAVPNLYLARNFGTSSGALVFMRGVGEGDSIFTNDPPVGIYVDDVILPRSTGSLFDLLDVERIEVLRGPQGTLYGRNTSGGAIKLVTRRPTFDRLGGNADLTLGSYGRIDARAAVNLPLASGLAARVSAITRNQRGWGRNLINDARVNTQDLQGGRVSLLWEPTSDLSLYASADATRDRSSPRYPQRFAADPLVPGRYTNGFVKLGGDIDAFESADTDPLNRTDTGGAWLRIDYRGGGLTASSITGYRALRSQIGFDQTANPPGIGSNVILLQDQHQHSFSQELQLAGNAFGARLDWLVGGFYFSEHNDQLTAVSLATPTGSDARFRNHDFFNAPSRGNAPTGNWSPYEPRLDTDSYSAFGSATLSVGARAHVTAGLRYTDERKRYVVRFLMAPEAVLVLPDGRAARRRIAERWTDLSPRLAVDYQLLSGDDEAMAYASAAKGFRSGSFDGRARNISFALERQGAIAPETVWTYEAGVKSRWFDRRLLLNANYFVSDYTDIAFSASRVTAGPPEIFRQNVGDARIQGFELEWTAQPLTGVELGGWIATLADRFTRLISSPGCIAFVADERDLDLRFTPAFRYQVRASLTQPLGDARVRLGGDISGASDYNIALCNEPQHHVDNAETINMQAAVDWRDWGLVLTASNLADRRYNTGSVGTIGYPVAPREVMLQLRRRF
ncbi:TonB-dependent receptor [Sphingomonas jeddahensis]|uniref:Pesticin receptor n=1 Tax=Sphingomonas jeddahensis TaxID=1915074 RepID=A0A1V2ERA6_9SPHN|nr:TonB-dependent receptor [Sphingomonas jeddahensis]ONF95083.1 Pesticin receptor precursor [Sphingomonas jeddahensis]